jgi:UDP-N-acetylenolpyruvoylglucosamine reductase
MDEALNAPLAKYSTLKIGGEASRLCHPRSTEDLVELVSRLKEKEEPWFVIGGGSNLLISSKGFEGTVIRTTGLTSMESPQAGVIEALAGTRLPHLAKYAAARGLSGLEFAVGIPGTVGGAVIMNAGAHGSCIANILETATILDTEKGTLLTLEKSDLDFTYRRCKLDPNKHVVVSARFRMDEAPAEEIEAHTKENEDYRWRTQPIGWPNCGSTFKNPLPDKSAGFLLDQAGAKNMTVGKAAVSAMHANFVINLGGATSDEVTALLARMKELVYSKFDITMTPEWKTLGSFTDTEKEVWGT